jgi:hypothetical protein
MTLKKLFLAAMASVLVSTGMQAQVENFEGMFYKLTY